MVKSNAYDERRLRLIGSMATGNSVLDIGYAQQPNPYLAHMHRVGLDLNRPPVDHPVRYEEELVGDALDCSALMQGRTFDTVICAEIIEHLENPYQFLRGLRDFLRPDGRLIISTPNPLAFPVVIAEALRLRKFFYTSDHTYYFLPRWVERILERTGYELLKIRPVGLWTPLAALPLVPVALSYQVIYVASKSASFVSRPS